MITCTFEDGGTGILRHAVVDVIVVKDNKILMVKRAPRLIEGGKWGLIGGYLAHDETIIEGAQREILEETGYKTDEYVLLTITDNPQRKGENRQNIAFVFTCTATELVGKPDDESTEMAWFSFEALPDEALIAFDQAGSIENYLKYRRGELRVPLFRSTD